MGDLDQEHMNVIEFASSVDVDFEDLEAFYGAEWGRSTPLTDHDFYRWQFLDAPASAGESHFVVAKDADGIILGAAGLTPRPFFVKNNNEVICGAELTSLLVSRAARGKKVSSGIMDFCQRHFEFIFASGISQSGLPAYVSRGFRYFSEISRFVRVINKEKIKAYFGDQGFYARYEFVPSGEAYRAQELDRASLVDEALPQIQWSGFVRDAAHLTWRYFDHPYFDYQCFTVSTPDGSDTAFVALRVDRLEPFTVMHVLDVFGDEAAFPCALSFIDSFAQEASVDAVDFYSVNSTLNSYFLSSGWFNLSDAFMLNFPHLFHPIDLREPPTGSYVIWAKGNDPSFFDFGQLYISKQDANLDRPVLR